MRLLFLTTALLFGACTSSGDKGDDDDDSAATGDTDGGGGDPDVAPSIVSVDLVDCSEQQSAGDTWQVQITTTDPQGADTIDSGYVSVRNEEGGELANYVLACGGGICSTSFRSDYDGITCSLAGTISLVFQITDEDGNSSDTETYVTTE